MKKILLSLMLLFLLVTTEAQQWWKPTKREAYSYVAFSLSGVANGFNQAIEHHNYGMGNNFVDISESYKRKYKNYDAGDYREAYWGSKTFLVWTTDAFHLTNMIDRGFMATGIVLNTWDIKSELKQYKKKDRWKVIVFKKILIPLVLQHLAFEITYTKLD
jgi:uncharacterized protein YxeA